MKNYLSLMLIALLGLFTSCDTNEPAVQLNGPKGDLTEITIGLSELTQTRAAATAFADPLLTSVDVTLIVAYEGKVVYAEQKKAQDLSAGKKVTYKVRFVTGQTYDVMAWADFGKGYYTLDTMDGNVPTMTLSNTALKTLSTGVTDYNLFDAYFQNKSVTVTASQTISLTLTRPFALVKINATDWNQKTVKTAGLRPQKYATEFNAATKLDLISGATSEKAKITVNAYISEYDQDGDVKELSFDYLLADTISSILPDFKVTYNNGTIDVTDYTFTNIPIQRNYKTIISGNILTKEGTVEVVVDPTWNTPDKEQSL